MKYETLILQDQQPRLPCKDVGGSNFIFSEMSGLMWKMRGKNNLS